MNEEYTMLELIDLLESKAINGLLSLDDVATIVFDTRFPEHLSDDATEKLIQYSNEFKKYKSLGRIIIKKYEESIEINKKVIELKNKEYVNDQEDDIIVNKIYELKLKDKEIENEVKLLEEEFNSLHSYFKKIKNYK